MPDADILLAAKTAGFYTAHALLSVSEGGALIPIYAYAVEADRLAFERLVGPTLEAGISQGRARLEANPHQALAAALIYDGYVTLSTGKTDALIIEVQTHPGPAGLALVLPYRAASAPGGFAIHRPKILDLQSVAEAEIPAIMTAFLAGVDGHPRGARIWHDHLDESR